MKLTKTLHHKQIKEAQTFKCKLDIAKIKQNEMHQ